MAELDEGDDERLRRVLLDVKRQHADAITAARRITATGIGIGSESQIVPISKALCDFDSALRPDEWGYT